MAEDLPPELEPAVGRLPPSREAIAQIRRVRRRAAVERARRLPWYRGKLDHIRLDRIDDPEEWRRIPVLDKDMLRQLSHAELMEAFCIAPRRRIAEYWRSGGSTGRPLFYPRSYDDMRFAEIAWGRVYPCVGLNSDDLCHLAFPIGFHPAGQLMARSAQRHGVGMIWVGAGNVVPTANQIELIATLHPTALMSMPSFAIHLANQARADGYDPRSLGVRKIVCSAELLTPSKRERLESMWGAEVYDCFGMSEAGLMGAESAVHDGLHVWTDLFDIEVIDDTTSAAVAEGEIGQLCVTPLWSNEALPILRWKSGDLVSYHDSRSGSGPYAELFPTIRHANRTTGFFKIRGVNVNHADLETEIFRFAAVADYQIILEFDLGAGREVLQLMVEPLSGQSTDRLNADLTAMLKQRFELAALVDILVPNGLVETYKHQIKPQRFIDKR